MNDEDRRELLKALDRICTADSFTDILPDDIARFGKEPVYVRVYNLRKAAQTYGEVLDGIREALKLGDTHYLVMVDQVEGVVNELERLQGPPQSKKHGPYCRFFKKVPDPTDESKPWLKVYCAKYRGHEKDGDPEHNYVRSN
jgi:hypothetical protein